jgi:predicted regulator of Ras-like GTPase activity (Roadblock/LC7/MglB family)
MILRTPNLSTEFQVHREESAVTVPGSLDPPRNERVVRVEVDNPVLRLGQLMDEVTRIPGVSGVTIASSDGLVVGHRMKSGGHSQRVAAMAAALVSLSRNVTSELQGGTFLRSLVEMSDAKFIVLSAGTNGAIAVLITPDANLGLLFLSLERSADAVELILSQVAGTPRTVPR